MKYTLDSIRLFLIGTVLLITGSLHAQGISGTVTDESSTPLQGVTVWLLNEVNGYFDWDKSTTTAQDGSYNFSGLTTGTYTLFFNPGTGAYVKEYWNNVQPPSWSDDATAIQYTDGQNLTGYNASLSSASRITGRLLDTGGSPIANVSVEAYTYNENWWQQIVSINSDSQGNYSLGGLPAGSYRVVFGRWGGNYVMETWNDSPGDANDGGQAIILTADEERTEINATLNEGATISGTVFGEGSLPLSDVSVRVYQWKGTYWNSIKDDWTDSSGNYTLGGLTSGSYRISFSHNDYLGEVWNNAPVDWPGEGGDTLIITTAEDRTNIDATLEKGAMVSGVLLDSAGNPVVGMNVSVRYWNSSYGYWSWAGSTTTDGSGAYIVNQLRTGSYRVVFEDYDGTYVNQVYGNLGYSTDPSTGQAISVTAGATTTLPNVTIRRLGSISGTVLSADGSVPVSGVKMYLIDGTLSSHVYKYGWQYGEAVTDANGNFTFQRVLEGSYHGIAITSSIPENLLSEWQEGTLHYAVPGGEPVPVGATAIIVGEGENVQGVDFDLDTGSIVSGQVTGAGDLPIEGVVLTYLLENSDYRFSITTDLNGDYNKTKIPPGSYLRKVASVGFKDVWYDGANHKDQASVYILPAASLLQEDIQLSSGQSPAYVTVISDPADAEIFLNYQPTGKFTPFTLDLGLIEGTGIASHVVTLVKDGFPRSARKIVPAVEAETVELMFDLVDPAVGSLSIVTVPAGATVYVDRTDAAELPSPVTVGNLAPGSHVILLKKDGYLQPRPVIAWVEANQTTTLSIPLTADTSPALVSNITSVPAGQEILVDYLPSGQITDIQLSVMDPASHAGSGWHSASHTVMLRSGNWNGSAFYVDEATPNLHRNISYTGMILAEDDNLNGLPDQWEAAYDFANQAPADKQGAEDDADGDGVSNEDELAAGTNPLNASSSLRAETTTVNQVDEFLTVTFQTVPGRRYIVQTNNDLTSTWSNASAVLTATGTSLSIELNFPVNEAPAFIRLVVLQE